MGRHWILASVVAAVTLLPVGAAAQTDSTPPIITVQVSGALGLNGWHVQDTTVGWTVQDPQSGVTSTTGCDVNTVRDETTGRSFTCRATNGVGLTVATTYVVKLDERPPTVRPRPTRSADRNGWFNHAVTFTPGATDAFSGVDTCTAIPTYTGPNRGNARIRARCRDKAGHVGAGRYLLDYDDTAPRVRAIIGRLPDRYGWYARDVRVRFVGRDDVSQVAGCSSKVYRGPDTARASVAGWCRDRAGNQRNRTRWFRFSEPLVKPRRARVTSPPLLDWVGVRRALGFNVQVWHEGRKLLSKWPDKSRLQLERSWRYQWTTYRLRRGERYRVYVWPRFRNGYGRLLGRGGFTFVRSSSALVEIAAAGLEPATHGL
jgi:hypothetical protein